MFQVRNQADLEESSISPAQLESKQSLAGLKSPRRMKALVPAALVALMGSGSAQEPNSASVIESVSRLASDAGSVAKRWKLLGWMGNLYSIAEYFSDQLKESREFDSKVHERLRVLGSLERLSSQQEFGILYFVPVDRNFPSMIPKISDDNAVLFYAGYGKDVNEAIASTVPLKGPAIRSSLESDIERQDRENAQRSAFGIPFSTLFDPELSFYVWVHYEDGAPKVDKISYRDVKERAKQALEAIAQAQNGAGKDPNIENEMRVVIDLELVKPKPSPEGPVKPIEPSQDPNTSGTRPARPRESGLTLGDFRNAMRGVSERRAERNRESREAEIERRSAEEAEARARAAEREAELESKPSNPNSTSGGLELGNAQERFKEQREAANAFIKQSVDEINALIADIGKRNSKEPEKPRVGGIEINKPKVPGAQTKKPEVREGEQGLTKQELQALHDWDALVEKYPEVLKGKLNNLSRKELAQELLSGNIRFRANVEFSRGNNGEAGSQEEPQKPEAETDPELGGRRRVIIR